MSISTRSTRELTRVFVYCIGAVSVISVVAIFYVTFSVSVHSDDVVRMHSSFNSLLVNQSPVYTITTTQSSKALQLSMPQTSEKSLNQTVRTRSVTSTHAPHNGTQGYMIALDYEQQLTAGFYGFAKLASVAACLNLSCVEPYVQDTSVRGVPEPKSPFWKLSALYDLPHVNEVLQSCSSLQRLDSFETMFERASRSVIIVYLLTTISSYHKTFFSHGDQGIVEINPKKYIHSDRTINRLNAYGYYLLKGKKRKAGNYLFSWSRVVLIDARPFHRTYLKNITQVLSSIIRTEVASSGSATVVIDSWRGIHNKNDSKFFYFWPDFVWDDSRCDFHTLQHSEMVIEAARRFSLHLNRTRPVIGVHVRGERMLTDGKGNTSHYVHCLQQLKTLLQTLTEAPSEVAGEVTGERVSVFHDLGPFGSQSCTLSRCVKGRSGFLSKLEALGFPIVSYDPTVLEFTPVSPAFASFVEREYLSHVDILVTLGRGGFQQSIVESFQKNSGGHSDENLHRICSSTLTR